MTRGDMLRLALVVLVAIGAVIALVTNDPVADQQMRDLLNGVASGR